MRTAVSEIGERLWQDCQDFAPRGPSGHDTACLFVDGIAERIRPGQRREPVLAAWGVAAEGKKVLLHLMSGSKEDHETVSAFFQDMRGRGPGDPLLAVTGGAPGIIKAAETCFPRSERQRCLARRMRNLAAKVSREDVWPEFKGRATAVYQATSRSVAREMKDRLVSGCEKEFPTAVACFLDDFRSLHRPSADAGVPPQSGPDRQHAGEAVRRGAAADESDPQHLGRKAGPEADVRGHDPGLGQVERNPGDRLRTEADGPDKEGS